MLRRILVVLVQCPGCSCAVLKGYLRHSYSTRRLIMSRPQRMPKAAHPKQLLSHGPSLLSSHICCVTCTTVVEAAASTPQLLSCQPTFSHPRTNSTAATKDATQQGQPFAKRDGCAPSWGPADNTHGAPRHNLMVLRCPLGPETRVTDLSH